MELLEAEGIKGWVVAIADSASMAPIFLDWFFTELLSALASVVIEGKRAESEGRKGRRAVMGSHGWI